MSPVDSVQHIIRLVVADPQFSEDSVYAGMVTAGVSYREADLAYKFTQAAWGRVLLDGLAINFADDFYCLDGSGEVVNSGKLADEPHFTTALQLGKRYKGHPGFKRLAAMSADFQAVNEALNVGSRAENLSTAPLVLFLESPSEAGMAKAHRLISDYLVRQDSGPSQMQPPGQPHNQTLPLPRNAENRSWFQKFFGR